MSDADIVAVKPEIAASALITRARYDELTERASAAPDEFWAEECKRIDWIKAPTKIKNTNFTGDVSIKWFEDGTLNASANCLDRHLATRGDQVGDHLGGRRPERSRNVTYRELHEQVCRLANALTTLGRQEGRPGHHLPADGRRGRGRHARLRAHRRHPFRGLRRLLAGQPGQPHPGLQLASRSSPPTRAGAAAAGCRSRPTPTRRSKSCPTVKTVIVVKVTGGDGADAGRPRLMATRRSPPPPRRLPAGGDERRGPALHPLHLRLAPASPRACCTRPAATWSGPASPTSTCSTTTRARSTGARPMSAGSPATPISSMARSPTAPPR